MPWRRAARRSSGWVFPGLPLRLGCVLLRLLAKVDDRADVALADGEIETVEPGAHGFVRGGKEAARLFVFGVFQRDYGLIMGTVLLYAFAVAIVNLVVDVLYGAIDPRIRYD